jgi:DNA mismatch endonuclease (patch repair protein)
MENKNLFTIVERRGKNPNSRNGFKKGYTPSNTQREKMSEKAKITLNGFKKGNTLGVANKGKIHSVWQNEINRETMLKNIMQRKNIKWFDTRPELKMKELLTALGIKYEFQYRIDSYVVDFYIPSKNIVLQVDGNYWHNREGAQERDGRQNTRLAELGYTVLRFWEKDIMSKKIQLCL